ncbi:hypothetical protein SNE40_003090 [Patella caerulea]|uniref:alpha-1,2-Mannosidase n=2 Tax=Patella caerulea TaxID=87958 RepID=A0AAN8K745_PATCE
MMKPTQKHNQANRHFAMLMTFLVVTQAFLPVQGRIISDKERLSYRDRVAAMFHHAYDAYLKYAYPYDELRPLTCDGHDTWGSYSLTLVDALDTLIVMGNNTEFRRIAELLIEKSQDFFDIDINASVFETNIRVVGGLISAHLLSKRSGMILEAGWPCSGPLLRMAETVARKLLPAFDTPTGMPYGTVNLRHGVPRDETTITCTAGVGTFLIEFGTLSRLIGDPIFEKVAMRALRALWEQKSSIGMIGNHIDVATGKWTALDSGIGGGVDSYFEYLVKGSIMFNIPELLEMFREYENVIVNQVKRDDWYMWANMKKGGITIPVFTSLDAYWPGIQCMLGDIEKGMKTIHNFHQVAKQYGFTPEFYNIPKAEVHQQRAGYPLRPELVESAVYLYQATKDPYLLEIGIDLLEAIEHSSRTNCGYATIKDVRDHRLENRMESFFLAETTKYLYLLFDTDNFIHNTGGKGTIIQTPTGECLIDTGAYIFNTEAHPIDMAAVHCCSAQKNEEDRILQEFHDNINLLELLDITEVNGNLIQGKKMKNNKKKLSDKDKKENVKSDINLGSQESIDKEDTSQKEETKAEKVENTDNSVLNNKTFSEFLKTVAASGMEPEEVEKLFEKYKIGELFNVENSTKDESIIHENISDSGKVLDKPVSEELKMQKTRRKQTISLAQQIINLFTKKSKDDTTNLDPPDIHKLYKKMRNYSLNYTYLPKFLHCPALPYHMKLSVMGEMFADEY